MKGLKARNTMLRSIDFGAAFFVLTAAYAFLMSTKHWELALSVLLFVHVPSVGTMHDWAHVVGRLPRWKRNLILFFLSGVVMISCHAYWVAHMRHHGQFPLGAGNGKVPISPDTDVEGHMSGLGWWQAFFVRPLPIQIWRWSYRYQRKERLWLWAELAFALTIWMLGWVAWWIGWSAVGIYLIATPLLTWFGYPMSVWGSHHVFGRDTVTVRGWLLPMLTHRLGYHQEHHEHPHVHRRDMGRFVEMLDQTHPSQIAHRRIVRWFI